MGLVQVSGVSKVFIKRNDDGTNEIIVAKITDDMFLLLTKRKWMILLTHSKKGLRKAEIQ